MAKKATKKPAKKPKLTAEQNVTETRRQELVQELDESEADWRDHYKAASFGCHELLDRTAFVCDSLEQLIHSHPACVCRPEWFTLADRALMALIDLYDSIAAEHLPVEEETSAS